MPSAWTQNFYHTVFSTKDRASLITPELEGRLYPFLGGILRDLRCTLLAINGMPDHLHLLIRYHADLSHSEMLQQIKGRSSKWVHETFPELQHFAWQACVWAWPCFSSPCPNSTRRGATGKINQSEPTPNKASYKWPMCFLGNNLL